MRRCEKVTEAILGGEWVDDPKKYTSMTYIDLLVNRRLKGFVGTYIQNCGYYVAHRKWDKQRESRAFKSKEEAMAWVEAAAYGDDYYDH